MRKNAKKILLLNFLVILFLSCSLKQIKSESPEINNVIVNDKYKINLPEEHSSGYLWQLSENYDRTIIDNLNTVWHGNEKGVDFNFNTLAIGQTTLNFVLRKHNDTSDVKHFIVNISIK